MNKDALYGNHFVKVRDDVLELAGNDCQDLIDTYSTPTFVFLAEKIRKNIRKIVNCFSQVFPGSKGFYSTKSNYLPSIVKIIMEEHFGAEIVTGPEFNSLLSLKFPLQDIIAGGPYLPDYFLRSILTHKVSIVVIYDLDDFFRIEQVLTELGHESQDVIVRFRSPKYTGRQGIGYTPENLQILHETLQKCTHIKFKGLLSHFGSQLNSIKEYQKNIQFLIAVANDLREHHGLVTQVFNIGGGFPNADSVKKTSLVEILIAMKQEFQQAGWVDFQIIYEPGRYIVGDTGFCLARVEKFNKQHAAAFLDVGNNYIPKFMKSSLRFYNVSRIAETAKYPIDFMGNIPSDQDIMVKKYNFSPSVSKGDYVLIANLGAYALTFSNRFPYPLPAIILIHKEEIEVIHDRDDPTDITLH